MTLDRKILTIISIGTIIVASFIVYNIWIIRPLNGPTDEEPPANEPIDTSAGGASREEGLIAFVANHNTKEVLVVDLTNQIVKDRIQIKGPGDRDYGPLGIAITPDGRAVYVANVVVDNVVVINSTSYGIEATIPVGEWPVDVVISPDGSRAYVQCSDSHEVYVIRIDDNTVESVVDIGGQVGYAAVSSDGRWLYVTVSDSLAIVDTTDNTVADRIFVDADWPWDVELSRDGRHAYVTSMRDGVNTTVDIYVIDTEAREVSGIIMDVTLWRFPDGSINDLALSPDGRMLYAADSNGHTLARIDTTTNRVISKFDANLPDTYGGPCQVAFSPDGRTAYLLYWGGIAIDTPHPDLPSAIAVYSTETNRIEEVLKLGDRAGASRIAISP